MQCKFINPIFIKADTYMLQFSKKLFLFFEIVDILIFRSSRPIGRLQICFEQEILIYQQFYMLLLILTEL